MRMEEGETLWGLHRDSCENTPKGPGEFWHLTEGGL